MRVRSAVAILIAVLATAGCVTIPPRPADLTQLSLTDAATLTAWRWDALAWRCELPGGKETVALRRIEGGWTVTARTPDPGAVLLRKDCPPERGH